MPGKGLYAWGHRPSYANSFSYSKAGRDGVNMTLLNCTAGTSSLQEVYDVCSGGKPGSVFKAPNLKPVSMPTPDDQPHRGPAFVVCTTYKGPCLHNSDDPLACSDPTYPTCQRGINTWLVSSTRWRPVDLGDLVRHVDRPTCSTHVHPGGSGLLCRAG